MESFIATIHTSTSPKWSSTLLQCRWRMNPHAPKHQGAAFPFFPSLRKKSVRGVVSCRPDQWGGVALTRANDLAWVECDEHHHWHRLNRDARRIELNALLYGLCVGIIAQWWWVGGVSEMVWWWDMAVNNGISMVNCGGKENSACYQYVG